MKRLITFGPFATGLLAAGGFVTVTADAQTKPEEVETLYIADQYTYDDNLFRLPGESEDVLPEGVSSRDDYINRLTVGIGEDLRVGRQVFTIQGRAQDVRFSENDQLDHVAGRGALNWDWLLTSALTGTLGAQYNRTIADFANTLGTEKDILETIGYEGSIRYKLGPRWSLLAGGQHTSTEHDLTTRRLDNFEADGGRVGIQYATPTQHTFALEYRYLDAQFPDRPPGPESGNYEEDYALARMVYTLSVHTQLQASYGYVERTHENETDRFSGNVWRAEIAWQPRPKFSTKLAAWRELRAYADAQSDYFIAEGFGIEPTWTPIRQIELSFELNWEDQEYLGFDPVITDEPGRLDDVFSGLATFVYSPRENLEFELSYRAFERESNRDRRNYDAEIAGASFRWRVL